MPFGRSLLQRETLLRVSGEETSPEIPISFHSSDSTSNQWRKLQNPWFPDRTHFDQIPKPKKKKRFFAQLAHSAGPICIFSLPEEALDMLEFLPSWDSMDQDLLSLYGQYRSTLVNHMDVDFLLLRNWKHLFSNSIYPVHIFVSYVPGRNSISLISGYHLNKARESNRSGRKSLRSGWTTYIVGWSHHHH